MSSDAGQLWRRSALIGLGAAAIGTVAATITGIGALVLARKSVSPEDGPPSDSEVLDISTVEGEDFVKLSGPDAGSPGQYAFIFDDGAGHARVGRVRARAGDGFVRELVSVDRGRLRPGARGRISGWWFESPEALGLRVEYVTYPTELGPAEAWVIHPTWPRRKRWAVHVHGRGALPNETLRGVVPLARAGITSLVISYRNDPGAPQGRMGRYGLGVAEALDVDAAVAWALTRGAERITLVGWSMGGTAALVAAVSGEQRQFIDGLVLDSPAVDWLEILRYNADLQRAPKTFTLLGLSFLRRGIVTGGMPTGMDFTRLSPESFAALLQVPVLIHASSADRVVPSSGAERLARARPDLVQLHLSEQGDHVRLWNRDPKTWERVTSTFVRWLPRPAWRG